MEGEDGSLAIGKRRRDTEGGSEKRRQEDKRRKGMLGRGGQRASAKLVTAGPTGPLTAPVFET